MKKEKDKLIDKLLLIVIGILIGIFISLLIIELPEILTCGCKNDTPTLVRECSFQSENSSNYEGYVECNKTDLTQEEIDEQVEAWKIATCPCYKPKK